MTREEIALQLTLKVLDNFSYTATEYGGQPLSEHAENNAKQAALIFNQIYEQLNVDKNQALL